MLWLSLAFDDDGNPRARGFAWSSGAGFFVAVADGSSASCSIGEPGLTELSVGLRHLRTGARIEAIVTPDAGPIQDAGVHRVSIFVFGTELSGRAVVRLAR